MNAQTDPDVQSYQREGYLVVPDLLSPAECAALRAESLAVCRGERGPVQELELPRPGEGEQETMARTMVCVMVHKLDSAFAPLLRDPRIVAVLRRIIGPDVKAVHSQLYFKHAGMPGNAWHQDELFLPTRDRSLVTAWIALEDATVANGGLRFMPGSHRPSILWPMRRHNNPDLDRAEEAYGFPQEPSSAIDIELSAGSAVFFDGYLLHSSYPNRNAQGFRRSLLYVYCSAHSTMAFDPSHYQPTAKDYRDIVMVAGTDPYAWKGTERLGEPMVRKAGATRADLERAETKSVVVGE